MKRSIKILSLVTFLMIKCSAILFSQTVGIKSNLIYDVTSTINLGLEFGLSPKFSLDLSGNLNAWDSSKKKTMRHWMIQPELRYWFCEKFNSHFVALHAHGGEYNVGGLKNGFRALRNNRYEGWFAGAGVGYGYSWILSRHWNIEGELGIGYAYTEYSKFPCATCGTKIRDEKKHYWGATKAALNIIYLF